jgi:hypothetical protein
MPGRRITDYQVRRYMDERRKGATQLVAAARAGLSERSGRRYESDPGLPSQRAGGPSRRTRVDPLAEVWESEIVPMLAAHPRLRGTTILEELHRSHPGRFDDRVLRTLQRRLARWRAIDGPERELIFRQEHPPGWQGLSDFTAAAELAVTVAGMRSRTFSTTSGLPSRAGSRSRRFRAARASRRSPKGCRRHSGSWARCRRLTAPIDCRRRGAIWRPRTTRPPDTRPSAATTGSSPRATIRAWLTRTAASRLHTAI